MASDSPDTAPSESVPPTGPGDRVSGTVVRFRGTRGSIPSPGPDTVRHGGNTSCVEVRFEDTLLILDAGTGIRTLGKDLARSGEPVEATILLSHFHWDHVQGLPFFRPMHTASSRLHVVAPADRDEYVEERLARQMEPIFFPVPFHGIKADCRFTAWNEGPLEVGAAVVRVFPVRHPSRTVGYRIDTPTASICYIPDNELEGGRYDVPADWRRHLEEFVSGADILMHDTMYTRAEYAHHEGWGHSTTGQALDLARAAGVRHLVGFHHAPDRSDAELDRLTGAAQRIAGSDLRFTYAAEGGEIRLG